MLDKHILALKEKNIEFLRKTNKKFLGFRLPSLLRYDDSSLEISTPRGYTLIPRAMTANIKVFAFGSDVQMDVNKNQRPNVYSHGGKACSESGKAGSESDTPNINYMSDIHRAACLGDVTGVRGMVSEKKELLSCRDGDGNLPLHLALEKGYKEVAMYLIGEFPQGSYALNKCDKSPLYLAVVNGHKDLAEFMLEKFSKDDQVVAECLKKEESILIHAITVNPEMMEVILKHQPKLVTDTKKEEWSPFTYAASNGHTDIIRLILDMFPSLGLQINLSYPIYKACIGGHVPILEMIHSRFPEYFSKCDDKGQTILHHAAKEPKNKLKLVVSYLLRLEDIKGLIEIEDETNRTPLQLAKLSKNDEVVALFRQNMTTS